MLGEQQLYLDPLAMEHQKLRQRRQIAQAMMQESLKPLGSTEMVSGIAVRRSPLEHVAKLAQGWMGKREVEKADEASTDLARNERENVARTLAGYSAAMAPRRDPDQVVMDDSVEGGTTPAGSIPGEMRRPDIAEQRAAIASLIASGNPALQKFGMAELEQANRLQMHGTVGADTSAQIAAALTRQREGDQTRRDLHAAPSGDTQAQVAAANLRHATASGDTTAQIGSREREAALDRDLNWQRHTTASGDARLSSSDRRFMHATPSADAQTASADRRYAHSTPSADVLAREAGDTARAAATASRKEPTEGERLSSGYFSRMQAAENLFGQLPTAALAPGVGELAAMRLGGENVANVLARDPARQRAYQAQSDWVRAKLRKESGAVIGKEEMDREIQTYFPQIGDSPEVIAQKRDARLQAMQGMGTAAGRAETQVLNNPGGQRGATVRDTKDWKVQIVK